MRLGTGSPVPVTQLWSLAVEEQFYLFWPLVVFACPVRRTIWVAAAVCVAAPLLRLVLVTIGWSETSVYMATISRIDALLIGALLAAWLRAGLPIPSRRLVTTALMVIAVGGMSLTAAIDHGLTRSGVGLQTIGYSIISVSAALLILLVLLGQASSPLNRLFTFGPLRKAGKYSYAIYIFHPPVLWGLAALLRSSDIAHAPGSPGSHILTFGYLGFALFALGCTYVLSVLSWYLYEQHFLRLKNYFSH